MLANYIHTRPIVSRRSLLLLAGGDLGFLGAVDLCAAALDLLLLLAHDLGLGDDFVLHAS